MSTNSSSVNTSKSKRRGERARLAAERAGLLWPLLGLPAETVSTRPVFDDWTAKDILAHVASWDELFTERIELNLAGRREEIVSVDLHQRNARTHRERKDWSLDQALDACISARTRFLDTLARVPDEELDVPCRLPWRSRATYRTWTRWRYQHDVQHADHLRRWRRTLRGEPTGPESVLLACLRAARKELLTVVALVPEQERAAFRIEEGRTLTQMLADLSSREQALLSSLEAGDEFPASNGDQWHQGWRRLHDTHHQLLKRLESMSAREPARPFGNQRREAETLYAALIDSATNDRRLAVDLRAALNLDVARRLLSYPPRLSKAGTL